MLLAAGQGSAPACVQCTGQGLFAHFTVHVSEALLRCDAGLRPVHVLFVVCCQDGQRVDPLMVLPVGGDDFAVQRVWLCGSTEDNRRYYYTYKIENIIE